MEKVINTLMAQTNIYRGISFIRYKDKKTLTLSDIELVKQDLVNHIYTRWRERIMMPSFGTRIPEMPYEQLDSNLIHDIEQDLLRVVDYDPRVQLITSQYVRGIRVTPLIDDLIVVASIDLLYIELNVSETLEIRLEFGK